MKFKEGVQLIREGIPVEPVTVEGMMVVSSVYKSLGITGTRAVVTSVCDGKHMKGSKHYEGKAFDTRTWSDTKGTQMSVREKGVLAKYCQEALGPDWDVVQEHHHLHIEYDPE